MPPKYYIVESPPVTMVTFRAIRRFEHSTLLTDKTIKINTITTSLESPTEYVKWALFHKSHIIYLKIRDLCIYRQLTESAMFKISRTELSSLYYVSNPLVIARIWRPRKTALWWIYFIIAIIRQRLLGFSYRNFHLFEWYKVSMIYVLKRSVSKESKDRKQETISNTFSGSRIRDRSKK